MIPIKTLYGTPQEHSDARDQRLKFDIHNALPCVVQEFDAEQKTVDVQPAIRERYVGEDGKIQYVQYPLLINVPVCFPCAGGFVMHFPINKGDECLVVFSDIAIDYWFEKGNVQNPVEQRRHDLSDGMAIFGLQSIAALDLQIKKPNYGEVSIMNTEKGTGLFMTRKGIQLRYWDVDEEGNEYFTNETFGQYGL